jgi:hypothetical protein
MNDDSLDAFGFCAKSASKHLMRALLLALFAFGIVFLAQADTPRESDTEARNGSGGAAFASASSEAADLTSGADAHNPPAPSAFQRSAVSAAEDAAGRAALSSELSRKASGDEFAVRLLQKINTAGDAIWGYRGIADLADDTEEKGLSEALREHRYNAANAVLQAAADAAIGEVKGGMSGGFIKDFNLSYKPGVNRAWSINGDATASLWESQSHLFYAQVGGDWRASDPAARAGAGYRTLLSDNILFGIGAFSDYLDDAEHGNFKRRSWGAEVKTPHIDFAANIYKGLGGVKRKVKENGDVVAVYTADGWDAEIDGRIPGAEWMEFSPPSTMSGSGFTAKICAATTIARVLTRSPIGLWNSATTSRKAAVEIFELRLILTMN